MQAQDATRPESVRLFNLAVTPVWRLTVRRGGRVAGRGDLDLPTALEAAVSDEAALFETQQSLTDTARAAPTDKIA